MARRKLPQGERLALAIKRAKIGHAELGRRLADRPDTNRTANSFYRSIKRWIKGDEPMTLPVQALLEDELGLTTGYLFDADPVAVKLRETERRLDKIEEGLSELRTTVLALRGDLS